MQKNAKRNQGGYEENIEQNRNADQPKKSEGKT